MPDEANAITSEDKPMRPVTLFTGQWADLPLAEVAQRCNAWGFDGLELACAGDHFMVERALADVAYVRELRELLERHNLACWAIGAHLIGQAVCDPIDDRHRSIVPAEIWGDGDPKGVRDRATRRMKDTARAAAALEVRVVTGFTGSPIWRLLYPFPPNDWDAIDRGYEQFAQLWTPIIDVFEAEGVQFALEVHPTEIAYDFVTTRLAIEAIGQRAGFALNIDPSHFVAQFLDPAAFILEYRDRIAHVHIKDAKRRLNGRRSILGSHLEFGDPERGWTFVSPGHGDVDFDELVRALNHIGYAGPLSIEWEDAGMEREWGAKEALEFVRRLGFRPSTTAFDAAFAR
jgi:sugar phosphate isomerase/epimerase